jgi:hypothetical protein
MGSRSECRACLYGSDTPGGTLAAMKKFLAIAAAGGALAIGVPAALAATDAPDTQNTPVPSATPTPDQQQPRPDHDCPEHDGGGRSGDASVEL